MNMQRMNEIMSKGDMIEGIKEENEKKE